MSIAGTPDCGISQISLSGHLPVIDLVHTPGFLAQSELAHLLPLSEQPIPILAFTIGCYSPALSDQPPGPSSHAVQWVLRHTPALFGQPPRLNSHVDQWVLRHSAVCPHSPWLLQATVSAEASPSLAYPIPSLHPYQGMLQPCPDQFTTPILALTLINGNHSPASVSP